MRKLFALLGCVCLFAADPPEDALKRARAAADELTKRVRGLLSEELARGGPAGAVATCALKAQPATAAVSQELGLAIRRVSARYRNPADKPDAWETMKLRELQKLQAEGRLPQEISEVTGVRGGNALRYMRPLTVQPMCLVCHGDPAPEVRKAIAAKYPRDRATGYRAGDLRGAISVTVPLK